MLFLLNRNSFPLAGNKNSLQPGIFDKWKKSFFTRQKNSFYTKSNEVFFDELAAILFQ